jgi:hypothetical protein
MKLPNGENAIIDPRKLMDYSLSLDHDDGKHKAWLFQHLVGIAKDNAHLLLDVLKEVARESEAIVAKTDKYGQRYVLDFEFTGPAGTAMIRSAWIIRTGEELPRLVTCYVL